MNRRVIFKAILDGFIEAILMHIVALFCISVYATDWSVENCMLLGALGALISAFIYFLFMFPEKNNKEIGINTAIRIPCWFLFSVIILLLPFRVLPIGETTPGDGFVIIFTAGSFIFASMLLRSGILAALLIINKSRRL